MTFKVGDFNPRPREEGDLFENGRLAFATDFNPRPREEGDYLPYIGFVDVDGFQSTPS